MRLPLSMLMLAACDGGAGAMPDASLPGFADAAVVGLDAAPEQLPPVDDLTGLETWLAAGHYLSWHCEKAPHPARPPGAHGSTRICSNEALSATSASSPFPVGAASVKELYTAGGQPNGHAVAVKLEADSAAGAGWYWYERLGGTLYANGSGVALCTDCHAGADSTFAATARDFVFTVVP